MPAALTGCGDESDADNTDRGVAFEPGRTDPLRHDGQRIRPGSSIRTTTAGGDAAADSTGTAA